MKGKQQKDPQDLRDARYRLNQAILRGLPQEEVQKRRDVVRNLERKP